MGRAARARLREELDAIYGELPRIACTGACHEGCGPISWSAREAQAVTFHTGEVPTFGPDLKCTFLNEEHRCRVYEMRPLICRMFGLVEKMKCPAGCVPERWLTDEEARGFFQRIASFVGAYALPQPRADVEDWIKEAYARVEAGEKLLRA